MDEVDNAVRVGELAAKGWTDTEIARDLGWKKKDVKHYREEFQEMLRRNADANKDLAHKVTDVLFQAEHELDMVKKEAWRSVKQADDSNNLSQRNNALKIIQSIAVDKTKLFHQAGVTQDSEILAELQEKTELLEKVADFLRDLKSKHPELSRELAAGINRIYGEVEVVEIVPDDD